MNLKAQYAHIFQINYGIVCGDYFQVKKTLLPAIYAYLVTIFPDVL